MIANEDDFDNFETWLARSQGIDLAALSPDEVAMWRGYYDEARQRSLAKVGLMNLRPIQGEHLYAVAVREDGDLWLTLWIRRSRRGEFFVMVPRGDSGWDPHTSYHLDGSMHSKSYGHKFRSPQKQQPWSGVFRGTAHLGAHGGHGPKRVGAVCDPTAFSGIVELAPGVLGPRDGTVLVDLIEPGCEPISWPAQIVRQEVFRDALPWVVIRICAAPAEAER